MSDTFLVLNRSGQALHATADPQEAEWLAGRLGPVQNLVPPGLEPSRNPPLTPERALALSGLRPVAAAPDMTEAEAWKAVQRFVRERDRLAMAAGEKRVVKPWELPSFLRPGGMLGTNTKLEKIDPEKPPAVSLGLSLVPERSVFLGRSEGGAVFHGQRPATGGTTLCAGSTAACRASCLMYSGQQQSSKLNNIKKMTLAKMLLGEPEASLRLLMGAVDRFVAWEPGVGKPFHGKSFQRFVRWNVLSDIPVEAWSPWLPAWAAERGCFSYDYTKVENRKTDSATYDLSFSYGGTPASLAACDRELHRGRRIVMVFVALHDEYVTPQVAKRFWGPQGYYARNPLPKQVRDPGLNGGQPVKVIDGDRSDIRPYDEPGPRVVGLRWKPPRIYGPDRPPLGFVVRGTVIDDPGWGGRWFALSESPLSTPQVEESDES